MYIIIYQVNYIGIFNIIYVIMLYECILGDRYNVGRLYIIYFVFFDVL